MSQDIDSDSHPIHSLSQGCARLLFPIDAAIRGLHMLNFIYNPVAGKGKAQRFRAAIEAELRALGVAYCFWETAGRGDATRIARELTQRGECEIVAMGGDGTVHEVLNGLEDPGKVDLGLIPCGSGNDFAAFIGIPQTPEGALNVLMSAQPRPTDYLECSGIRGLNVIGAGIDVEILKHSNRARVLRGRLNYFTSLILALIQFQFYRFRAEFNGERRDHKGLIVCACNGRRIGGGIGICPAAQCDDGRLDVVMVENVTKAMIPGALVRLAQGKILQQPYTRHERADRLQVWFDPPTTIQIDGELYDNLPFDVRIVSDQLRVYRR